MRYFLGIVREGVGYKYILRSCFCYGVFLRDRIGILYVDRSFLNGVVGYCFYVF